MGPPSCTEQDKDAVSHSIHSCTGCLQDPPSSWFPELCVRIWKRQKAVPSLQVRTPRNARHFEMLGFSHYQMFSTDVESAAAFHNSSFSMESSPSGPNYDLLLAMALQVLRQSPQVKILLRGAWGLLKTKQGMWRSAPHPRTLQQPAVSYLYLLGKVSNIMIWLVS